MSKLNPEKLRVSFKLGVTDTEPVIGRKYTLTHSDTTAELFLTIGLRYAYEEINAMRDEVLAEWRIMNNQYYLYVYLYVDGQFGPGAAAIRNTIFRRELPLALEAIRYGDNKFFRIHPRLDNAPIIVYFHSSIPEYNRLENWGKPSDYKLV